MSKTDPTRTATLRRKWMTDLRKRMNRIKKKIISLVVIENAFSLGEKRSPIPLVPVSNTIDNYTEFLDSFLYPVGNRFQASTDDQKAKDFQEWLAEESKDIVDPDLDVDQWYEQYIEEGYRKGAGRAFDDTRKAAKAAATTQSQQQLFEGSRREFLESSFSQRVSSSKVKFLASRVFTELKGVTSEMEKRLTRHLVDGLTQGDSPRTVARRMSKDIDKITKTRALVIARTETVRAHAEGQLDALETLGVTKIGVTVEWSTAGDGRVCQLCQPLNGVVLTIKEARGILPRHPSCRCAYIPANVGESKSGQKRGKTSIDSAIDASVDAESKEGSLRGKKEKTSWVGVDKKITKGRPKSVLDKRAKKKTVKKKITKKKIRNPKKKSVPTKLVSRKPPEGITYTGEQTEFTNRVWDEIEKEGGINTPEDAKRVGKLIREEAQKRYEEKNKEYLKNKKLLDELIKEEQAEYAKPVRDWDKLKEIERKGQDVMKKLEEGPKEVPLSEFYLEVLSETRDMGGIKHNFVGDSDKGISSLRKSEEKFPTDWLKKSSKGAKGDSREIEVVGSDRGYYRDFPPQISVGANNKEQSKVDATATHELMHSMENHASDKLPRLQREYVESRAKEGEKPTQIYPNHPDPDVAGETAIKNEFNEHYMGKLYQHEGEDYGGEVMTMGYEGLMHEKYEMHKDEDMTDFVLGVVAGV